ncbi:hypothetical protein [Blastopirellula marina]|nr:hypothetical protein [Blastopirellula marina]
MMLASATAATARTWNSADGKFLADGVFLSADFHQATIQLADQSTLQIPLNKFCLADQEFIDDALEKSDADRAAKFNQTQPLSRASDPVQPTAAGAWMSAVDPPQLQFAIPADVNLQFPIFTSALRVAEAGPAIAFPASPSPYCFHVGSTTVGDLRTGATQTLKNAPRRFNAVSISPDGAQAAFVVSPQANAPRVELLVWDVASDAQKLSLPLTTVDLQNPAIEAIEHVRGDQILLKERAASHFQSLPLDGGPARQLRHPSLEEHDSFAISPGGKYLLLYSQQAKVVSIHDVTTDQTQATLPIPPALHRPNAAAPIANSSAMSVSANGRYLALFLSRNNQLELAIYDLAMGKLTAHQPIAEPTEIETISWFGEDAGCMVNGTHYFSRETAQLLFHQHPLFSKEERETRFVAADKRFFLDRRVLHVVRVGPLEIERRSENYALGRAQVDLRLPPLTTLVDESPPQAWQVAPGSQPVAAPSLPTPVDELSTSAPLPSQGDATEQVLFSLCGSDAGRIIYQTTAPDYRDKLIRFDLHSGDSASYLAPDAVRSVVRDVSPSGRFALLSLTEAKFGYRSHQDCMRLDVFDADTMQPHVSFRTGAESERDRKSIVWGGLLDDEHAAALTADGVFRCWTLPDCQLHYSLQLPFTPSCVVLSRRRDRIAFLDKIADGVAIVDAASGTPVGRLNGPFVAREPSPFDYRISPDLRLSAGAFSADGKTLWVKCSLPTRGANEVLSGWNLETGQTLPRFNLPRFSIGRLLGGDDGDLYCASAYNGPHIFRFVGGDIENQQSIEAADKNSKNRQTFVCGGRFWHLAGDKFVPAKFPSP